MVYAIAQHRIEECRKLLKEIVITPHVIKNTRVNRRSRIVIDATTNRGTNKVVLIILIITMEMVLILQ